MATPAQIEANRRNALKSTGPRTPQGKAAVSMNSLRHGLRARTVVLPGENREEFNRLCDDLEREWGPESRTARFYLEQMAVSQWKLTRMEVAEAGIFKETLSAKTQLPLLDRLWQAQQRLERSYARAQRELERLQPYRPRRNKFVREQPAPQPAAETPAPAPSPAAPKPSPVPKTPSVPSPGGFPRPETVQRSTSVEPAALLTFDF